MLHRNRGDPFAPNFKLSDCIMKEQEEMLQPISK
jgi:hypothetical protein